MIKILNIKTDCTNTMKIKFISSTGYLDVTNNSLGTLFIRKDEGLVVVDLRSIGYYEVKQSTIQHNLQNYYEFNHYKCYLRNLIT